MPRFDVHEVHRIRIAAPPDVVYEAARTVTAGEVRLFRPLMLLRMMPTRLRGRMTSVDGATPLLDLFLRNGFLLLDERPGSEFVAGAIGRFWSLRHNGPVVSVTTAGQFDDS